MFLSSPSFFLEKNKRKESYVLGYHIKKQSCIFNSHIFRALNIAVGLDSYRGNLYNYSQVTPPSC